MRKKKPDRTLNIKPELELKKLSIREKILRAQNLRMEWFQRLEDAKTKVAMLDGEINGRISDILENEPGVTPDMILQQVNQMRVPQMPSQEQIISKVVKETINKKPVEKK